MNFEASHSGTRENRHKRLYTNVTYEIESRQVVVGARSVDRNKVGRGTGNILEWIAIISELYWCSLAHVH
jgi:hypothetical protein